MAHLIRFEVHADHRYRVVQTGRGFHLAFTVRSGSGLDLEPQAWLYRTQETAEKGFRFVVLMNAWWDAVAAGHVVGDLAEKCEAAAEAHAEAAERHGDRPLTGQEVFRPQPCPEGDGRTFM